MSIYASGCSIVAALLLSLLLLSSLLLMLLLLARIWQSVEATKRAAGLQLAYRIHSIWPLASLWLQLADSPTRRQLDIATPSRWHSHLPLQVDRQTPLEIQLPESIYRRRAGATKFQLDCENWPPFLRTSTRAKEEEAGQCDECRWLRWTRVLWQHAAQLTTRESSRLWQLRCHVDVTRLRSLRAADKCLPDARARTRLCAGLCAPHTSF